MVLPSDAAHELLRSLPTNNTQITFCLLHIQHWLQAGNANKTVSNINTKLTSLFRYALSTMIYNYKVVRLSLGRWNVACCHWRRRL